MVTASCEVGQPLWCFCHSLWGLCRMTAFPPTGTGDKTCQQYTPRGPAHRRRGVGEGSGSKVYALCSEAHCTEGQFSLTTDGENLCLEDCPPGYYSLPGERECVVCPGASSRRRTQVCNDCPAGYVPQAGSDECVNVQASCGGTECNACASCMGHIAPTLASCVNGDCYHPGTTWCAAAITGLMQCKVESLGCWYKILCSSACICSSWKNVFCGGQTSELPCPQSLVQIALLGQNASLQSDSHHRATSGADSLATTGRATASLDETLSDKCV